MFCLLLAGPFVWADDDDGKLTKQLADDVSIRTASPLESRTDDDVLYVEEDDADMLLMLELQIWK